MAKYQKQNPSQGIISREGSYTPQRIVGAPIEAAEAEYRKQVRNREQVQKATQQNFQNEIANIEYQYADMKRDNKDKFNNEIQKAKNLQQDAQDMQSIAKFSKTLTEQLVEVQGQRNEAAQQRGLMKSYVDGFTPEEIAEYDAQENALIEIDTAGRYAGAEADAIYGPDVGRQVRKLSGWEAYGYAQGQAMQGGLAYGDYFNQAKQQVAIGITDENGQVKRVTYDSAQSVGEREAVAAAIRNQYMAQFSDMNPKMLNKYLFPKMKEYEAAYAKQWNTDQEARLEQERTDQAVTYLTQGFKTNPGATTLQFLNQFAGDFGGDAGARKKLKEILDPLVKNNVVSLDDVEKMLDYEFINRAGQKTTIGKQFAIDLGGLRSEAIKAENQKIKNEDTIRKTAQMEFDQQIRLAEQERVQKGEPSISEKSKQALLEEYAREIGGEPSDYLKNLVTREDKNDEDIKDRIELKLASEGEITMQDLDGASPALRMQYQDKVVSQPILAGQKMWLTQGEGLVKALTRQAAGLTGDAKITDNPLANDAEAYGQRMFKSLFAKYLKDGQPANRAYKEAKADLEEMFTIPGGAGGSLEKLPILTTANTQADQDRRIAIGNRVALNAVGKDPTIINKGVIPGTGRELEQLTKYAETGKGKIPDVYRAIAANSNGTLSTWDVAQAQLQATGKGTLLRLPKVEQEVKTFPPDVQRLLNYRPTTGRTTRAMLGGDSGVMAKGNWKTFLDLVASKESASYGEYDAYNMGGSAGGHRAHGSGNSATDGRYGKPLSQLTVNDVVQLGQSGQIWAAGRYQFIPGTLRETIKEAGLTGDEIFNAETQDRLAIARARWRMRTDRGMAGLRREWIGLNNVSDAVLRPAMQGIVNEQSPYNKPENISAGVYKAVYTTGNIGPTSTGQHLDVKRTDGSYFEYKDLDNFVDVQDPEFGRVKLSRVPETGDFNSHTRRGSHGRDYGTYSGSKLYLKNGAKVVSNTPTVHGDYMVIRLPDGREFSFLHGRGT